MAKHKPTPTPTPTPRPESAKTRAERITKESNAAAEGSDSLFEFIEKQSKVKSEQSRIK